MDAVGPDYLKKEESTEQVTEKDGQLRAAYQHSLQLAYQHGLAVVGFSLLSAYSFSGSRGLDSILDIACKSVAEVLALQPCAGPAGLGEPREVHLICFRPEEKLAVQSAVSRLSSSR